MINLLENILQTTPKESAKSVQKNDEKSNDFAKLFETFMGNVNRGIDNLKEPEYEIQIDISNQKNDNKTVNNNEIDKNNSVEKKDNTIDKNIFTYVNKKPEKDLRMNSLLDKLNIHFRENITDKKSLDINGDKIKIKLSQLNDKIKENIKNLINDFEKGKISDNQLKLSIKELVLKSGIFESLNISKDSIKDINIKKSDKKDNNKLDITDKKIKSNDESILLNSLNKIEFNKKENIISTDNKNSKNDTDKLVVEKSSDKSKKDLYLESNRKEMKLNSDTKNESQNIFSLNKTSNENINFAKEKISDTGKVSVENRDQLFAQMAKSTKIMMSGAETKFSTMIRPESLGRMDFHINIKEGQLNGKIVVQTKDAFDFFRSNVEELRAVFQKSNVEFGKIDIALAGQMDSMNENIDFSNSNFNNQKKDEPLFNEFLSSTKHFSNYNNETENSEILLKNNPYSNYSKSKINLFI